MILLPLSEPRGIVLFAPGAGGDPTRYEALTRAAQDAGFLVAAPAHQRFDARAVTDEQARERAIGLAEVLENVDRPDLPVIATGHSVGGWAALCLAGAQPWSRDGRPLPVPVASRVSRVVALAPPLGWFRAPGALDHLTIPVTVMMGASDVVTPPETADILRAAAARVTVRTYEGVGHLDFLSTPPPTLAPTPGLDHPAFLASLAQDFVEALG